MRTYFSSPAVDVLALALFVTACSGSPDGLSSAEPLAQVASDGIAPAASTLPRVTNPSTANLGALGAGNRAFAFDLYHRLARDNPGKNLVFSPYSISTALGMTYAGARGATAAEMKSALHFDLAPAALHEAFNAADLALASRGKDQVGADGTPFRLNVNNALWAQRGLPLEQPFLDTLSTNYGGGLFEASFAEAPEVARHAINGWVEQKTEGLVPELLSSADITEETRLVLTNTVYFNASWQNEFDEEATRDAPFTKLDGTQKRVSMMHDTTYTPYARGANFQAIAMPYASNDLSFVAVLPNAGSFEAVESGMTQTWFDALRASLTVQGLRLGFPKLDYKAQAKLKPQLLALGMQTAFDAANFSGLSSRPLKIKDVVHEAVIKVFEGGTIAAASTAVIAVPRSARPSERVVTFDRPFLYAIVDAPTGQILFLGRVLDPTAK